MTTEAKRLTHKKQQLSNVRADLGWSQELLAAEAHVTKTTVNRAEAGRVIIRLKARAIWNALNKGRTERGIDPLDFDEIEWNLRD